MALRRLRVAKFFGKSSSLLEGGPRGWRTGCATRRCTVGGAAETAIAGTGRIPRPSYSFLAASSRGERGGASLSEDAVRGVLGVDPDLDDETEELSSPSPS